MSSTKSWKKLLLFSALLLFPIVAAFAQGNASPIEPNTTRKARYGIAVGIPGVMQNGAYNTSCDCPAFEGGGGSGITIGALYEPETSSKFIFGIMAGYDYRYADATYTENLGRDLTSRDGEKFTNVLIQYRHTSSIAFGSLFAMPYFKYYLGSRLFVRMGAQLGSVVYSYLRHDEEILSSSILLPNGEVLAPQQGKTLLEEGKFPNLVSFQAALNPAIGFELKAGTKWSFMPVVQYSLPLTGYSSRNKDFSLSAWQIFVELHYNLEIVE